MKFISLLAGTALVLSACAEAPSESKTPAPKPAVQVQNPDWSKDAVIYQINTRQYSEAGTFDAVRKDLPRIKELGVDILWLMPIHPIGEAKRKGPMGSPYAVKDFQAVNPELGTLEDFKTLVQTAQDMGMKVIIDWVANHTAWDNHLITEHPDWYTRNDAGEMQHPPDTDWLDVADLDYSKAGLRDYMTESLLYWVRDVSIDGYRCDVAGMVPTDFWNAVRPKLDAIKPVFMLAEWEEPELHEQAFDATYAWKWKEAFQDLVNDKADATDIAAYYKTYQSDWPVEAMRMTYTSNHDQNTWDGTPFEIYGDAYEAAIALSFTGQGLPLIYNGQEGANDKRLKFFEKDEINWNLNSPLNQLFKDFAQFKTDNPVLWNGSWGTPMTEIRNDNSQAVFSFIRETGDNTVLGIFNLSDAEQSVSFTDELPQGRYTQFPNERFVEIATYTRMTLGPWEYRLYSR